jgi:hypothetical protein
MKKQQQPPQLPQTFSFQFSSGLPQHVEITHHRFPFVALPSGTI